ncbi:hypothetical protein MYA_1674 [Burkholderia sp. KJ006]|nr:hypothetical protein MYA_1674 [Burkholderia sp. KJ006]
MRPARRQVRRAHPRRGRRASWFVPMIGARVPSTIESAAAL